MSKAHPRRFHWTEADYAWMEAWYRDGYSTAEIGRAFDCLMGSVFRYLQKRNVPMRPNGWRRPRYHEHSHGYVLFGGEYEHRRIAGQMLGRALRPREVVHHKNGDRADNRPENLEVCASHGAHMRHHDYRSWTPEREAQMLAMRQAGMSVTAMMQVLNCSRTRINNRIWRLIQRGTLARVQSGSKRQSQRRISFTMSIG